MNINKYFEANPGRVRPRIQTKRRILSVQASWTHYCSPKDNVGPYTLVEVKVSNGPHPRAFIEHSGRRPSDGVYGWVPVSVVEAVIERDGLAY